ncbi:hypothetical protein O3G_MSEX014800 [Manduca sexta]|uniref:Glucose-1-phosphatase n=2 Tax=Manduca sexta TaxID=7130 RepID=A0A921ZVQ5_MANSE|nr:hypothetical protein O3G_MSEX014800 [Manduca sexta]
MLMMLFLLAVVIGLIDAAPKDMTLKSVLVLSRHNIRTPLTGRLEEFSEKEWPKWDKDPSYLTDKGFILEGYMGEFFYHWLRTEGVLPEGCPDDSVYIYANTRSRTKDTAIAFAKYAFKNCDTPVHFLNIEEMDPIFNPVIHNTTDEFRKMVTQEIEAKLNDLDLTETFEELNRIVALNESEKCKNEGYCDFTEVKNTVWFEIGEELDIDGPLRVGNSIIDSFMMSYYDGKPDSEVAWGEITTPEQWELLSKISKENQNVRFNLTTASTDLAGPLLKYMSNVFLDNNSSRKFTLLVGHDSNLNPVINALEFQPYVLVNQYEPFPIGGKLVFENWSDGVTDYLKIEYIYQSWFQLRNGVKINLDNPPQRVVMELKGCKSDDNGFCLWSDFVQVLKDII